MHVVVDAAIPWVEVAFSDLGRLTLLPGREIRRDHLLDADALVVRTVTRVDGRLLEGTPVRFVGSATTGTDHVALDELEALGIDFAHAPGCNAEAVAEWVAAAIPFCAARGDPAWACGPLGIVGLGRIGQRVWVWARALGIPVRVCDPPLARTGTMPDVDFESLSALLTGCSALTVHVPLTDGGPDPTRNLLDAAAMRTLLQAGTLLVHTSRGGVIDEAPLHVPGWPGRAALDVWAGEPDIDWALVRRPSVLVATPHVAGYSQGGKRAATLAIHGALCRAFGLEHALELPPAEPDGDVPLARDTEALRAIASQPAADRPRAFTNLRDTYPLRGRSRVSRPSRPGREN